MHKRAFHTHSGLKRQQAKYQAEFRGHGKTINE